MVIQLDLFDSENNIPCIDEIGLKMSQDYMVKIGRGERSKGIYLGTNSRGNGRILMNFSSNDFRKEARIYTFKKGELKGNCLDIFISNGPYFLKDREQSSLGNLLASS